MGSIIKRDLLTLLRDRGNMFFVLLFPSLMVLLLGSLLQSMDSSDNFIEPIKLAYTIETTDPYGMAAIDGFLEALTENDAVTLLESADFASAKAKVDNGEASVAVHFSQPLGVELYKGYDKIQNRAADAIFQGFTRQANSMLVVAKTAPRQLAALENQEINSMVAQKEFGYSRTMMDYYAVAMLVMIIFMGGGVGGVASLYESRKDGTLARLLAAPKSRISIYVQSVIGVLPHCFLQVFCVMASSVLLFGAHYADTWQNNLLLFATFFIVGYAVFSAFMLVGLLVNINSTFIIMPVMWGLMFISGTFSKEIYIKGVSELSPIWQLQNAAFDLTVFGRGEKCVTAIFISIGVLVVSTMLGAFLLKRKEVVIK